MSAGSLVGGIVTVFGAVAGGALVAQGINPELHVEATQAWVIFLLCYGAGVIMLLSFARHANMPAAMQWPGAIAILLGVIAGAVGLGKALGLMPAGASASLWAIFVVTLPVGVLLLHGAAAMRNHLLTAPK